jgi:hypothetical protein
MCDIWARVAEVELQCKKAARRQAMQRHNNVKRLVCRAFGSSDIPTDSTLFRAACGFVEGSQEQYHHCDEGELRLGCNILKRLDKNEEAVRATRCMEKQRKELLTQMVTFMFEGEVALDIEKTVLRKKRFSTVKLARVSDMSSSFNPSALGAIASCEGGKGHGEMGLLCGESTLRSLGKLKDAWTYEWISGAKCVSKVKLHWDQSKRIFSEDNMVSLIAIIRLAIRTDEQVYWITFMAQYIKLIDLMTVSRDYSDEDIDLLEVYCDTTYRLLISHCGGQAAVSNYFHYIGSGHLVWMCRAYGNIWRYRNEGVEAFNKCLSKRTNMFNSHGNRGNITDVGIVEPFEVMGKWMARYAMWQLDLANQLFIPKGSILGASEVKFDPQEEIWEYVSDHESDDDDDYSITSVSSGSHSESDVDDFLPEDVPQCVYTENEDEVRRYSMRKRLLPK